MRIVLIWHLVLYNFLKKKKSLILFKNKKIIIIFDKI